MFSKKESFLLFLLVSQAMLAGRCLIRASDIDLASDEEAASQAQIGGMESVEGSSLDQLFQNDKIKIALRRYIGEEGEFGGSSELNYRPTQAIKLNQSPSQRQRMKNINNLLMSSLVNAGPEIIQESLENYIEQAMMPNQYWARPNRNGNQATNSLPVSASPQQQLQLAQLTGQKMIRNVQPVFMRLPPRFGKRSLMLGKLSKG